MRAFVTVGLEVAGLALGCLRIGAKDWFVAPGGTPFGLGTPAQPYDLGTALSGQVGQPGDTFWLRGGNYRLGHLNTSVQGAPGSPVTFRQVSGENARIDGSLTIFNSPGYVTFRDFELYSSDTNRVSSQTNAGFNVTDIALQPGAGAYAPNLSFINLVVHDQTRHGIYSADTSYNTFVYGCVLFNNGWVSPDNAEGHGLYAQGNLGITTLENNIVFNNAGANMHVYANTTGGRLSGVTLNGNVAFNAGAIQQVRTYRDWLVGVDAPAVSADRIVLQNNMGYEPPGLPTYPEVQIGRDSTNGSVVLTDNYMPLGLLMNNWRSATISGNLFAPKPTAYLVNLNQTLTPIDADWDDNTYVCDPTGGEVQFNVQSYSFSGWQAATGFDLDSTFVIGALHGAKVFVRTNLFEPGRANIIVYNWDDLANVSVDVGSVLPLNSSFEVRNAQNFFAGPVLSGIFHGQRLQLPMTNLTVAPVNGPANGPLVAPPPTSPTFNVFVLVPIRKPIQIKLAGGSVQVSWAIGAGANALQTTPDLTTGFWSYSTITPAVVGDQYMITEAPNLRKFYRLRPQ